MVKCFELLFFLSFAIITASENDSINKLIDNRLIAGWDIVDNNQTSSNIYGYYYFDTNDWSHIVLDTSHSSKGYDTVYFLDWATQEDSILNISFRDGPCNDFQVKYLIAKNDSVLILKFSEGDIKYKKNNETYTP